MTPWSAVVRALPVTFALYVIEACAAVLAGLPAALELTRAAPSGSDGLAGAAWLELLASSAPLARTQAWSALLIAGLLTLLSPWLHMAWLSALSGGGALASSFGQGRRLYLRACSVTLLCWLGGLLGAAPWGALAWGASRWLDPQANARLHDLAIASCLLPVLVALWFAHTWSDLSRARALYQPALSSVRLALRAALRPRVQLAACGLWLLAHALVLAASLLSRTAAESALPSHVALVQASLFLRLIVRSRWLASALACAEGGERSGAWGPPQ